jgi:ArsR family transcriptional regulator
MTTPLHHLKADFYNTLSHPARIRVLELLTERDHSVAEMLDRTGLEASNLSQQLGVLRRSGLVAAVRVGSTVSYSLSSPEVGELMAVARRILTTLLSDQLDLLSDLRDEAPQGTRGGSGSGAESREKAVRRARVS